MIKSPKPQPFRIQARMPPHIAEWIKAKALKNYRSFNSELVETLRESMRVDEKAKD